MVVKLTVIKLQKIIGGLSRNPNSQKYFIKGLESQANLIKVLKELKKVAPRDIDFQKSQLLESTLDKTAVIIKIGDNNDMDNEYTISKSLRRTKGFIKFLGYFTCEDDFREFFQGKRNTICTGKGNMKVIIIPYYELGSLASYNWSSQNIITLQSSLYLSCLFYMDAYIEKGFIHNDFHAGNILLKSTKQSIIEFNSNLIVKTTGIRPWICDFEKSVIAYDVSNERLFNDFKYDLQKLFFLLPTFIKSIDKSGCTKISTFIETNLKMNNIKDVQKSLGEIINANIKMSLQIYFYLSLKPV